MEIKINKDAKDYIKEKTNDNSINVVIINTGSGWCPRFEPSVKMGKPRDEKRFNLLKSDDMDVYVWDELMTKGEKMEISMGKFLWKKHLNVEGLSF